MSIHIFTGYAAMQKYNLYTANMCGSISTMNIAIDL